MPDPVPTRPVLLVVDPLPADRKLARLMMSAAGWSVREADTPEAALTALREAMPSVILLDLGMPVTTGLDFVHRIRALPGVGRSAILGTSALGAADMRAQALAAGCTEFIPKPLDTRTLPVLIGKLAAPGR